MSLERRATSVPCRSAGKPIFGATMTLTERFYVTSLDGLTRDDTRVMVQAMSQQAARMTLSMSRMTMQCGRAVV
jgi:hypothetical protein